MVQTRAQRLASVAAAIRTRAAARRRPASTRRASTSGTRRVTRAARRGGCTAAGRNLANCRWH